MTKTSAEIRKPLRWHLYVSSWPGRFAWWGGYSQHKLSFTVGAQVFGWSLYITRTYAYFDEQGKFLWGTIY